MPRLSGRLLPSAGRDAEAAMRKAFADKLWKLLQERGWSQSDLARRAGVGRDAISTYVTGKALPTVHRRAQLAQALNIDPAELYPLDPVVAGAVPSTMASVHEQSLVSMTPLADGQVRLRINMDMSQAEALSIVAQLPTSRA